MPRVYFSLAVLLLCLGGVTGAEPRPAQAPLDTLIQRSGLDAQLVHFEAAMQRGITLAHASQQQLPPTELSRMRKAVSHAYAANACGRRCAQSSRSGSPPRRSPPRWLGSTRRPGAS